MCLCPVIILILLTGNRHFDTRLLLSWGFGGDVSPQLTTKGGLGMNLYVQAIHLPNC